MDHPVSHTDMIYVSFHNLPDPKMTFAMSEYNKNSTKISIDEEVVENFFMCIIVQL